MGQSGSDVGSLVAGRRLCIGREEGVEGSGWQIVHVRTLYAQWLTSESGFLGPTL